ncbi:MAG: sodium:panthothenate symporter, partial [Lentisphaeria bacterium]|nr:sodium:panthothenate symporter [Lentisphaeria bacterium]
MTWYDWLIIVIPVLFVFYMGIYTRRYLRDVTAFLSAGRVCGRYVISVGNIASALSIIGLLAYVEIHYKTGFALSFWQSVTMPISVLLGLYGYCTYRFRETKAQSIGQFFEMRYSRKFRVFAAGLRSLSEMLANMIMPALAARFFMYFLDLPKKFTIAGIEFGTFNTIMVVVLIAAISIICMGGSLAIIVTDTIQGFICYPLMALFAIFILCKFSWSNEIMPVLSNRVAGENFLNPYDISRLRDFNYFALLVSVFGLFMHRSSWTGAGGRSSAAKTPHEQKMAALLGTWRNAMHNVFYVLLAVALLAFMNHASFAPQASKIR